MSKKALDRGTLSWHVEALGRGTVSIHVLGGVAASWHAFGIGTFSMHVIAICRETVARHDTRPRHHV